MEVQRKVGGNWKKFGGVGEKWQMLERKNHAAQDEEVKEFSQMVPAADAEAIL